MFYGHSANVHGQWEPLVRHLSRVAKRAAAHARAFGAGNEGGIAGLLHDLGKYGDIFQRRLRGEEHGVDHWSPGAWEALQKYKQDGVALALAIQGHHIGLQRCDKGALEALNPETLSQRHPLQLTLSECDCGLLRARLRADGLELPRLEKSIYPWRQSDPTAAMLDIRMLFSSLVDADYIETEAHFAEDSGDGSVQRPEALELRPERSLEALRRHLGELAARAEAGWEVMNIRADLLRACEQAAAAPQGLFTLSAPTGAGKTLAMLAFALRHAQQHRLRRVIFVIPYLSIIEQTAQVYRGVFQRTFGNHYILEDHSLAGSGREKPGDAGGELDSDDARRRAAALLSENWDAPLIVTTSVQFLESLFSNRPSACRKLHNLAGSVVLFDEVQTLPAQLAVPTLATLGRLSERYATTVVFATATQPAFSHLDAAVKRFHYVGWRPAEIVPPQINLFQRARRTRVSWPDGDRPTAWSDVARGVADHEQCLCIVNLKRHALDLAKMLKERGAQGLFHLSASMCPAHRQRALSDVRRRLQEGAPCRLVSTQCVEAGVDVDFPVVYRAWAPLEAIAQAAGRCNRNGAPRLGEVHVFLPEQPEYPGPVYRQAADVTSAIFKSRGPDRMDISDPQLFDEYYRSLYDLTRIAGMGEGRPQALKQAIEERDFVEVAHLYRIIKEDTINLLVPYHPPTYGRLADEVRARGITSAWVRRARPHTVSLFRPRDDAPLWQFVEPVPLTRRHSSEDWYVCLSEERYDRELLGLTLPEKCENWSMV